MKGTDEKKIVKSGVVVINQKQWVGGRKQMSLKRILYGTGM